MNTLKKLPWYMWVLWLLVILPALALSGWSMFTLGIDSLNMPVWIAAVASAIFDIGGMFLAILSIFYAMSNKSNFTTEIFAFAFMAVSAWINWEHAQILHFPTVGMVMFASASVVSALVLKSLISYLSHRTRENSGRTVSHLPTVGVLTWILQFKGAWTLLNLALQARLQNSSSGLVRQVETPVRTTATWGETHQDTDSQLFSQAEQIVSDLRTVENKESQPEITAENSENTSENLEIFRVAKSGREIARIAVAENICDAKQVYEIAVRILGPEINPKSIAKAVSAAKKEFSNA